MSFNTLFNPSDDKRVFILDGGTGSTLILPEYNETTSSGLHAGNSPLWSSELLRSDNGIAVLKRLTDDWVRNGAEVVMTNSYQSSLPLFVHAQLETLPQELSEAVISEARGNMTKALDIVVSHPKKPITSLALGPIGAQMNPGQEYGGRYCHPFDEFTTAYDSIPIKMRFDDETWKKVLSFQSTDIDFTAMLTSSGNFGHEEAQTLFHLSRVMDFATSPEFEKIGFVTFETIPRLSEIRAIRRAVGRFNAHFKTELKFSIALVFPLNGGTEARFPDPTLDPVLNDDQVMDLILEAFFGELPSLGDKNAPIPGCIGINCSSPKKMSTVIQRLANRIIQGGYKSTWLILYPDGGTIYDMLTRTWTNPDHMSDEQWSNIVLDVVEQGMEARLADGSRVFEGTIVGGCCNTTPHTIGILTETMKKRHIR